MKERTNDLWCHNIGNGLPPVIVAFTQWQSYKYEQASVVDIWGFSSCKKHPQQYLWSPQQDVRGQTRGSMQVGEASIHCWGKIHFQSQHAHTISKIFYIFLVHFGRHNLDFFNRGLFWANPHVWSQSWALKKVDLLSRAFFEWFTLLSIFERSRSNRTFMVSVNNQLTFQHLSYSSQRYMIYRED